MVAIVFTPLGDGHLATLAEWLRSPHVSRWWPDPCELPQVTERYHPIVEGTDTAHGFVIELDDIPIGYIQSYRLADEPQWSATLAVAIELRDAAGIDYLIGAAEMTGRGYGTRAIREFVASLWQRYEDVSTVVVPVQQANVASWRALERAGFRRAWEGLLDTDEPGDQGPAYIYVFERGTPDAPATRGS